MRRIQFASLVNGLRQLSTQGFPWTAPLPDHPTDVQRFRSVARGNILSRYPQPLRSFLSGWMVITWPIYASLTTVFDPFAPLKHRSIRNVLNGIINSVHPLEFAENSYNLNSIYSSDLNGVYNTLNVLNPPVWIHDKREFAEICKQHDIPHPELINPTNTGALEQALQKGPLVVKPAMGSGGRGVTFVSDIDRALTTIKSTPQPIVQSAFGHGLDSDPVYVRLVTGKSKDGGMNALAVLSNASFLLEKGEITGGGDEKIAKKINTIKQTIMVLHSSISGVTLLGWDILCGDAGVVVLEANQRLSLLHIEQSTGQPIAESEIATLLSEYIP